jgi:hypothetical protein
MYARVLDRCPQHDRIADVLFAGILEAGLRDVGG